MMKNIFLSLGTVLILSACSDSSKPNVEVIQDMMESPALKPQEYDKGGPNDGAMRIPPEGTQPVGFEPYRYSTDVTAAAGNKNPMAGDFSEDTLKIGIKYYTIHCSVCHGANGEGGMTNNSIGEKMALKPPAVTSDKIKGWTDGQIYHVITMGQGVMGPYAAHIPQKYRWQVVNYIRHLQGKSKGQEK
jgi:mono/diheme cytochrome c family protein